MTVIGNPVILSASTRPKEARYKYRPTAKKGGNYRGSMLLDMNSAGDLQFYLMPQIDSVIATLLG